MGMSLSSSKMCSIWRQYRSGMCNTWVKHFSIAFHFLLSYLNKTFVGYMKTSHVSESDFSTPSCSQQGKEKVMSSWWVNTLQKASV